MAEVFHWPGELELFQRDVPKLIQCTSCNTTALCRTVLAALPLGLKTVLGNLDRRSDEPHNVVKISPNEIEFVSGAGHQGKDTGTIFKMYISQCGPAKS
jgi:glyceraldehyde-3-phosphate dehydrogenase (NAD(P)+) (phosphorylating)